MPKRIGYVAASVIVAVIAYVAYNHFTAIGGRVEIRGALTIDLPSGSHHRVEQGIDTYVGTIALGGTRSTLNYDIGHLAGNYATYEVHQPFVWQKRDVNDGVVMDYSLQSVDRRQTLFVSFPDLGPANFCADVRDSSEIDAILDVMRTVRPSGH